LWSPVTPGGPLGLPSPFGGQSRYRSGWYSLDLTRLYVSRHGVGTGRIPARLLAPARCPLHAAPGERAVRDAVADTTTD